MNWHCIVAEIKLAEFKRSTIKYTDLIISIPPNNDIYIIKY